MSFMGDAPPKSGPEELPRRATRDLLLVLGLTLSAFLLAAHLELHELFSRAAADLERWQVDELPATLTVLIAGLAWFAWRRWRESVAWMAARRRAESVASGLADENRALARRLMDLRESERAALARDLHDDFGPAVHLVRVEAAYLGNMGSLGSGGADAAAARIREAGEELNGLLRGMLADLRPVLLDEVGLAPALEDLCATWAERSGIPCRYLAGNLPEDLDGHLPADAAIALYRAVQEGLLNVMKHAQAREAAVRLAVTGGRPRTLELEMEDDGQGMGEEAGKGRLGLLGMGERMAAIGAAMMLDSGPRGGVRIRIRLALTEREG